jgi:hypothetical protein
MTVVAVLNTNGTAESVLNDVAQMGGTFIKICHVARGVVAVHVDGHQRRLKTFHHAGYPTRVKVGATLYASIEAYFEKYPDDELSWVGGPSALQSDRLPAWVNRVGRPVKIVKG